VKRKLNAGSTNVTLPLFVRDGTSTSGAGLGSLVHNSAGLTAKYRREGQNAFTSISLVTATVGTYTSGGFIASGGIAGSYELGVPDAALASGAKWVELELYGAANMVPVKIEIELDAVNYQDATRFGMTALPNAAAEAAGGLITRGTGTGQLSVGGGRAESNVAAIDADDTVPPTLQNILLAAAADGERLPGRVKAMDANVVTATAINADAITAAKIAADVTTEIQSGLATAANLTTLLNRLGAFTGTGVNTVLGFLLALLRKDASTPSDIGGTYSPASDSLERLGEITGDISTRTAPMANAYNAGSFEVAVTHEVTSTLGFSTAAKAAIQVEALAAANSYGALKPTVAGRTLDVSATGGSGLDWANVKAPTTSVSLTGTTISTSQQVASVSGAVGSVTGTVNANLAQISGDATAADNLESAFDGTGGVTISAAIAGNITGNLSGSVGSVSGNVGGNVAGSVASVTGNVGGNVAGSIGSLGSTAQTNVRTQVDAGIAAVGLTSTVTGRIDASVSSRLASASYTAPDNATIAAIDFVTDKLNTALEEDGVGSGVYRFSTNALELAPVGEGESAATIADAVWDEARAGHTTVGTFGHGVASVQGNVVGSVGSLSGVTFPSNFSALVITAGGVVRADNRDGEIVARQDTIEDIVNGASVLRADDRDGAAVATASTALNIQSRLPAALVGGKMDSNVSAVAGESATATEPVDFDTLGEGGGGTGARLTITPIKATATNPRYSTRRLANVAQGTAPIDIVDITDGAGNPVDLTDKSLRMIVCEMTEEHDEETIFDDELTGLYKYETGSGENLEIGGDDNNQVTIHHDAANTLTPGRYPYWLINVTDNVPLLKGILPVEPAVLDV
jgi:hypothetical protein